MLEFSKKDQMPFEDWTARQDKFQSFFGPGVDAKLVETKQARVPRPAPPPTPTRAPARGDPPQLISPCKALPGLVSRPSFACTSFCSRKSVHETTCGSHPRCRKCGWHTADMLATGLRLLRAEQWGRKLVTSAAGATAAAGQGVDVELKCDGSGAGRGGPQQKDQLPPLMPGLKGRQQQ